MRTIRFRLATSLLIAVALTAGAWIGLGLGIFNGQQLRLADALFAGGQPIDSRIVVVAIDDQSLEKRGRWPWDRTVHAALIDELTAAGVQRVGYDILFTETTSPASDEALRASLARAGNVVLASAGTFGRRPGDVLKTTAYQRPVEALAGAALAVAHVNVFPDKDGVVRSLPVVLETGDAELVPALSAALIEPAASTAPITIRPDGIVAGTRFIRTGAAHLLEVNYADKDAFEIVSAADVMDGVVPRDRLNGKIVLVGVTAVGLGDQKLTPIDKSDGLAGVLVHANAANTIATGTYLVPESRVETLFAVFVLALLTSLAVAFLRIWLSPPAAVALGAAFTWITFMRFDDSRVGNLVYPPITIVLAYIAALAVRYLTEFRERNRVTQVFARYVAKDVVDEVLASPEGAVATLAGASRPMSVLFADLRGFTSASENAKPEEVVAALNVYLDAMTQAVVDEQGTVDKFMGDCVMAFWGAPRPEPQHAERAARAAVRMLDNIDRAIKERPETALLRVKGCGVGIATGDVVVGNIGSHQRLDYTVIGDTVNTASRLCGVADAGTVII
ncbi:MAG TPA: adenylate/guanylate cyclase domain-containing protein, partial [Actinomycetota bacterium]|nr:adenylate/guanylate cyclase domain-containing protein [Actinomycetota bacterium]